MYTFIYLYIPSYTPKSLTCLDIPPYTSKYPILEKLGPTKNTKMVITRFLEHPPRSKFNKNDSIMSLDVLPCPKGGKQN